MNRYNHFIINGFKFHTKENKKIRKIYNGGVMEEVNEKIIMIHLKILMSWIIMKNFN